MKEIKDILQSFEAAQKEGKRTALATVVHVEGSSYRRPGARMLVTEDGRLTGAISGGCLEGDALRKALLAINQQQNKLVTYDTTDEDDAKFGVQLGCNGIVHILFEPINPENKNNPVKILQKLTKERQNGVLVTLFSLDSSSHEQPGTCLLCLNNEVVINTCKDQDIHFHIEKDAQSSFKNSLSFTGEYLSGSIKFTGFVEFLTPVVQLVIAGAGNDAIPLVEIASILGWDIVVADGRTNQATNQRFPKAQKILVAKPDEVTGQIDIDGQTVFVLMTHNYNYDRDFLRELIRKDCLYIGSLGPKKKLERMLDELRGQGTDISEDKLAKIYGPVGLDIGSETPEEIALSIVSEIKAVLSAKTGNSLRDKINPIHSPSDKDGQTLLA
ncbi:MAG TPA: alanine dehydrogenase [Sphingobacteriaceae bacterium]|nr:alanine dehydrogenase [Sphingobacteriaceae bacterium]